MRKNEYYFLTDRDDKLILQLSEGQMKALSLKNYIKDLFDKKAQSKTVFVAASKNKRFLLWIIDHIDKKNRIILWYWDTVTGEYGFRPPHYKNIECWSFDEMDCKKYNMKHNTQVYFEHPEKFMDYSKKDGNSVFYCGADRGRESKIREIYNKLKECDSEVEFTVVESLKHEYPEGNGWSYSEGYIPYMEYVKKLQKFGVICECMMPGQSGLTLRYMEALYFGKKLITDNRYLLNNNRNLVEDNIYIVKDNSFEGLEAFLSEPVKPWPDELKEYYRFSRWLERFENK